MRKGCRRWAIATTVVVGVIVPLHLFWPEIEFALIKLPRPRDPNLVGTWSGEDKRLGPEMNLRVTTTFRADGTGSYSLNGDDRNKFDWGTEGGTLYTRRMATDAWSGRAHTYRISADGRSAEFVTNRPFETVAPRMVRLPDRR